MSPKERDALSEALHRTHFRATYGNLATMPEWKDEPDYVKDVWYAVTDTALETLHTEHTPAPRRPRTRTPKPVTNESPAQPESIPDSDN